MRRVFGADAKEFLLLLEEGGTHVDAVHGTSTQFMLNLSLGLRAVTKLLRRGGWAVKDLPHVQSIEVDPDRLSGRGRPTIRSRRIPAEKVAILAQTSDGHQSLESDYRLSAKQIEDAVRWYEAVSSFEKAADGGRVGGNRRQLFVDEDLSPRIAGDLCHRGRADAKSIARAG